MNATKLITRTFDKRHSKILHTISKFEQEVFEHKKFLITLAVVLPLECTFAFLYCFFFGFHNIKEWKYVTKPLPMILLIATVSSSIWSYGFSRFRGLILTAFVLSLIADIILIIDEEIFFLIGLVVFALAHFVYILAFSAPPVSGAPYVPLRIQRSLPFVILVICIPPFFAYQMLAHGHPTEMVVAVTFYCFVIGFMGWRTAARIGYPIETRSSQVMALIGVIFFMCSDFLLAYNRFHTKIPLSQVWILLTYWTAQTLIAISIQRGRWVKKVKEDIKHFNEDIKHISQKIKHINQGTLSHVNKEIHAKQAI